MTPKRTTGISPHLKVCSGFHPDSSDQEVLAYWKKEFPKLIDKPCASLLWCPYGSLIDELPLDYFDTPHASGDDGASCQVLGHDCPAFHVAEPYSDSDAA